jgi:uncharacterized protein YerC
MPHISKRFLEKNKYVEIHKQLYKAVFSLVRSGKTKLIFDELLTKTEKIMLAKRLTIIIMIDQKESIYAIENTLKVSPSTVARMQVQYDEGEYKGLLEEIKQQNSFFVQIQKIIPPRVGKNRFKNFLQF